MSQISFDADAKSAVALTVPPDSAGDLRSVDMTSGAVAQLTDFNRKYFEERPPQSWRSSLTAEADSRSSPGSCSLRTSTQSRATRSCWTFTVAARGLLGQLQPPAADTGNRRVYRSGCQPARFIHLRHGFHDGCSGRLGRRGLPGHHVGGRSYMRARLRGRGQAGHHRLQLRRFHELLDYRPRHPLQGRRR